MIRKSLVVLGVPIDCLTMDDAVERLDSFVLAGRATNSTHQVATINADFVVNAQHDPELRQILQEADMTTADGMPLVWAARLFGISLAGRVTGVDLVPALCERAAVRGYSVFFLGAGPGVASRAAEMLSERYPGLRVAGVLAPPQVSLLETDPTILETVKSTKPDILFVAFGNPKQEKWISMYARALQIPVCIGVGGTFDLIAGVTRRAPQWMQSTGLEWLFRFLQEPRRLWRRYVHDLFFFGFSLLLQWILVRRQSIQNPLNTTISMTSIDNMTIIQGVSEMNIHTLTEYMSHINLKQIVNPVLVVNLEQASYISPASLGTLVTIANTIRSGNGSFFLMNAAPRIIHTLELMHLNHFFEIESNLERIVARTSTCTTSASFIESRKNGWLVVEMPRRVDASNAENIFNKYIVAITSNPHIILDFTKSVFLSSAGMAAMLQLSRAAKAVGGDVQVVGCSADILRCIKLVKLDAVISMSSS